MSARVYVELLVANHHLIYVGGVNAAHTYHTTTTTTQTPATTLPPILRSAHLLPEFVDLERIAREEREREREREQREYMCVECW